MQLICDICGVLIGATNIGFVRHPVNTEEKATMKCKTCHTTRKRHKRQSSYMFLK